MNYCVTRFYANTTAILRGVLANLRSTLSSGTVTRDVVGSPWADVKCPSVNITPTRSDAGASQQGNTIQCRYTSSTNSTIIDSEHQENKVQYSGGASSTLISKQARISRERERERERDWQHTEMTTSAEVGSSNPIQTRKWRVTRGKVHPRTSHEGPKGE